MLWYFSMYQRFSLLYLGIATGAPSVPSAFQTQGHRTEGSSSCRLRPAQLVESDLHPLQHADRAW